MNLVCNLSLPVNNIRGFVYTTKQPCFSLSQLLICRAEKEVRNLGQVHHYVCMRLLAVPRLAKRNLVKPHLALFCFAILMMNFAHTLVGKL